MIIVQLIVWKIDLLFLRKYLTFCFHYFIFKLVFLIVSVDEKVELWEVAIKFAKKWLEDLQEVSSSGLTLLGSCRTAHI